LGNSEKSKAFADLVLSMSDAERGAMALDLLNAMDTGLGVPAKLHSIDEIQRVSEALNHLAHEIVVHHPGRTGW
jgi:hypothetical protein